MVFIQMTGLSGAGKSSLAFGLKELMDLKGHATEVIDGDHYRKTVCSDLGFSHNDRRENIRRLGRVANEFYQKGIITLISAINPFEDIRYELTRHYNAKTIWIRCNLDELIRRDTKGLYRKAALPDNDPDKVWNLTGVNDDYEIPLFADCIIDTSSHSMDISLKQLERFVFSQL